MGLLVLYRRPFALVLIAALAAPAVMQLLQPVELASEGEARMLAPVPGWPRTGQDWLTLPGRLNRFLSDHFGGRTEMVRLHGRLRYAVDLPSDLRVVIGRNRSLFLAGDATIDQATGAVLRTDQIAAFADSAAALRTHLAGRGARLLVAIPPNSATINYGELPAWVGPRPAVTEYDLMMQALAARGVPAVDLRAPLVAAKSRGPTYRRTDTHWNRYGALVAYNAVVQAVGRPDWVIDPARTLRGFTTVEGGDLARLLAVADAITDEDAQIDLSAFGTPAAALPFDTQFESGGDLVETGRNGPAVLVIGDSFTRVFWQDYFALNVGRYAWMHHELCGFKLSVLDKFGPELVILAPAERQMFCAGGSALLAAPE
jgi:alginate O-acetyltransferase complex protein AlgJ